MPLGKYYTLPGWDNEKAPLTFLGDISLLDSACLAVVGPRNPLVYTTDVVNIALRVAALYEIVVVSGGAPGVDQHAHCLAMELGIPTICILGSGLSWSMDSTAGGLLRRIVDQGGLLISQFPDEMRPARWSFPQRNKLIAKLSKAVFCPAAAPKSGSMSTIRHALALAKPVWTVPGPLRVASMQGTNALIGAGKIQMTTLFHDMVSSIAIRSATRRQLQGDLQSVVNALGYGAKRFEELQEATDISTLSLTLLNGQSQGVICQQHNGRYVVIDHETLTMDG